MTLKVSTVLLGVLLAGAAALPISAADTTPNGAPPALVLGGPGVAWLGFVQPKESNYEIARTFNDFSNPSTGIGPVTDDPAHPFANNEVAREMGVPPTYRIANLDNAAGKNLMPWVREALERQNALVLQGKNGETREARCWETGVPAFHLNPGAMFFIQTPKEVVMFLAGRQRHIWLNVPHSPNLKPSWYGESVGHYEGDTLIVDTTGFNEKTFVDSYRTPHTDKLHVVERFRLIDNGNTLQVSFTVNDPGAFYQSWSGTRNRHKVVNPNNRLNELPCAEANDDYFNQGLEAVPAAEKTEF